MKIIDLLNKIANGEEVPKVIRKQWKYKWQYDEAREEYTYMQETGERFDDDWLVINMLNDEVEIIEEEKKIPEKLPYYSMKKIQKAKNKDEWQEERITLLEKRVEDLHIKMNDLLDYLKSKGE